jgi:hypothetical protein
MALISPMDFNENNFFHVYVNGHVGWTSLNILGEDVFGQVLFKVNMSFDRGFFRAINIG